MAGIVGVIGTNYDYVNKESLIKSIDPLLLAETSLIHLDEGFLAVSVHKNRSLNGPYYYEDSRFAACFGGDLISNVCIPWNTIIGHIRNKYFKHFREYKGNFTFVIFDKEKKELFLISDRVSFYPIFYSFQNNFILISTSIPTFCKLQDPPRFNRKWLYEYLFFNFPINQRTILENVFRMPPASVLICNLSNWKFSISEYMTRIILYDKYLTGKEARDRALNLTREVIPKYFGYGTDFAHGLSSGFDTRTLLSFVPQEIKEHVLTYTYGVPECNDIIEAVKLTRALNFNHVIIPFDKNFLEQLPQLIYETVFLSGGMENINRSSLSYVYKTLTDREVKIPFVISGIETSPVPIGCITNISQISHHMQQTFFNGKLILDQSLFKKIFGNNFNDFAHHISAVIDWIISSYGELESAKTYCMYMNYEAFPKYYSGELSIANNFTSLRLPLCDQDIVQLMNEVSFGALKTINHKPSNEFFKPTMRKAFCAFLLQNNPDFKEFHIHGLPLRAYSNGKRYIYYRLIYKGPQKLLSRVLKEKSAPPLEDWAKWHKNILNSELNKLISDKSLLLEYIEPQFMREIKQQSNLHWLKLITTAELSLKMIKNSWSRKIQNS